MNSEVDRQLIDKNNVKNSTVTSVYSSVLMYIVYVFIKWFLVFITASAHNVIVLDFSLSFLIAKNTSIIRLF